MKRTFDIILSLISIILLFPILVITALWIVIDSPGGILFVQDRPGLNNKIFKIYKFRSMKKETPNVSTDKLKDSNQFITKPGHIIRKTSIDELPQLINILKGDMSFVGPRPALYNQYDLIEERTKRNIHTIRPGLTGYAQVMGRDNISDEDKIKYDEYYLKNRSFKLDLQIIFKTFLKVIKNEDVIH
ncbi:sugar transferase [Macrococcus capreoli]